MSVGTPVRLRNGKCDGQAGVYWAWPIDGYFDLHHAPLGVEPDGSDVIAEGFSTLSEARAEARELVALEKWR